MARQTPLMIKSFAADSAVTNANVCVVASGTNPGNVAAPSGALATKFIGVTQETSSASSPSNQVSVMVGGIAQIQTDGSAAVAAGDYVAIANASGQIKSVTPATGTNVRQIVGIALSSVSNAAGLLVDVLLQPMVYVGA